MSKLNYYKIIKFFQYWKENNFENKILKSYLEDIRKYYLKNNQNENQKYLLIEKIRCYPYLEFILIAIITSHLKKNKVLSFKFEKEMIDKFSRDQDAVQKILNQIGDNKNFTINFFLYLNLKFLLQSFEIFAKIKEKKDILKIELDGIIVGDLIYDTYLKKYNKKTVNIKSPYLLWVILQSIVILNLVKEIFLKYKIEAVFPGDVSYIYSGILARYSVYKKINCFLFTDSIFPSLKKFDKYYYRRENYWDYRKKFNKFSNYFKKLSLIKGRDLAKQILDNGKDGNIDLPYLNSLKPHNIKFKFYEIKDEFGLIALHDFSDSPHIYRWSIFEDIYEWLVKTVSICSKTNLNWLIKPHPNSKLKDYSFLNLKKYGTKFQIIPKNLTNQSLIKKGLKIAITSHGSIAHELPYFGIPVVNAGDNPTINYKFSYSPKNIEEYKNLITNYKNLEVKKHLKNEIYEFFYMHYLHNKFNLPFGPVYPNREFIKKHKIIDLTPKEQRMIYHKSQKTLNYLKSYRNQAIDQFVKNNLHNAL